MQITRVETIPIRVRLRPGMTMKTAHGEHVDSHYVLVRVHTDAGIVGLGEVTAGPRWNGESGAGAKSVIDEFLAPAIVGRDPFDRHIIRRRMDEEVKLHPFSKAAIEMAIWDIAGKALKVPVYQLLGGAVRKKIRMKMVVGGFPPTQAAELARRFIDQGTRYIKVKVGIEAEEDRARVTAVRKVIGPNTWLSVDSNCGWDLTTATQALSWLEDLDVRVIEQPIPAGDPAALATLKARTHVPIMADESVFTLTDGWTVAAARAADVISVYPGKNGGIDASLEIVHLAKAAGLACHMGSNLELGVATAAMLHLAAACPNIVSELYPADLLGPLYHEWDIVREPLQLGPEYSVVPEGPGLGVEIDPKRIGGG